MSFNNHIFNLPNELPYPPLSQHYVPSSEHAKHFYPPPPPLAIPFPFDSEMLLPRKRTRTTPEQLAHLEKIFSSNPSPNNRVRTQLSLQLGMPERSIQIWFQNRRAKVKNQAKRKENTLSLQQYAANAAAVACQTAAIQQNQTSIDPNLYYYYYYYYYQQQQQKTTTPTATTNAPALSTSYSTPSSTMMPDLTLSASTSSSSITSDYNYRHGHHRSSPVSSGRTRAHSVGPYPYYRRSQERQSSMGPSPTTSYSHPISSASTSSLPCYSDTRLYNSSTILEETFHITPAVNVQSQRELPVHALTIGTWKRVSGLNCHIDTSTRTLVWSIQDEKCFRIVIHLHLVQFIRLEGTRLEFYLSTPSQIQFFMTVEDAWVQCHDFTQDQQATRENIHVLEGDANMFMDILMQAPDLQSLLIQEDLNILNHETDKDMDSNLLLLQGLHLPHQ